MATQRIPVLQLPDDEGSISALIDIPSDNHNFIFSHTLGSFALTHDGDSPEKEAGARCGGQFNEIYVSTTKKVLLCSGCRLRLSLPIEILCLRDLRDYFK